MGIHSAQASARSLQDDSPVMTLSPIQVPGNVIRLSVVIMPDTAADPQAIRDAMDEVIIAGMEFVLRLATL